MKNNHLGEIELIGKKTSQLIEAINEAKRGNSKKLEELLITIKHPGWTTIADIAFVKSHLDALLRQQKNINAQLDEFVHAASMVEKEMAL